MRNRIEYLNYTFSDVKISTGSLGLECSLPIRSLGIDTLEVDVKCNDPSITTFVQNTPITYFHRDRQMGVFFVQTITRTGPKRYTIYGISSVGRLDQRQHYGGIYTGQTAAEIIADICGNIPFQIKTNYAGTKLYGWLPIRSARENLAQVLFALGANLTTDQNGVLRIENLWQGMSNSIPADKIYKGGSIEYATPVTSFTVLEHSYVPGRDETDLFDGTTTDGQIITFNAPMHSLVAVGFNILESNANYAKVSAGSGLLSGKEYIHTTKEITEAVHSAPIENSQRIEDATLVSIVNSSAVAKRMADYYKHSETLTVDNTAITQRPGQIVEVFHPYDRKIVDACVASMDINLSAVLKSKTTALIGFAPPKPNAGYYDAVEVITADQNWVVPAEVTEIRIVLISGGSGGWSGLPGSASATSQPTTSSSTVSNMTVYYYMSYLVAPGEGGGPGEGGAGGRIFQATFSVTPGQNFAIHIGAGGTGGAGGQATVAGSEGGATTFGEFSSANGAPNPSGFLESVSGIIYGATGGQGISGARGTGLINNAVTAGPSITVNGVTYNPGASPANVLEARGGSNYDSGYGVTFAYCEAGYGGGAAYGANGGAGSTAGGTYSASNGRATARGGTGGSGANALPPPAATIPGTGGMGGNGGGGGGCAGRGQAQNNFGNHASTRATLNCYVATPGSGGNGSAGGAGAPGCVIIYYSRPKEMPSGAVQGRNKKFIIDRTGRLMVV